MNEQERDRLLDRVHRPSGTLGREIPDEITIQGSSIDVKAFVFECNRLETIPEDTREEVDELKTELRRERLERKQRIARDDISYEEGERLVASIRGIDRAINALEDLDAPDIGEQLRQKKMADARELLTLIRQAK